jgi:putative endopeptidase
VNADPAVNYGGIGGVIGHEISHGFDDQGRKSDGDGILRNWWTDEDTARSRQATKALGAQYDVRLPAAGAMRQRRADHGREHRRPRRPFDGLDAYS